MSSPTAGAAAPTLVPGSATAPAVRPNRRRLAYLAAAVLALAGAAGYGYHWWREGRFIEDTDDAYVGGDITVLGTKVPGYIAQVAAGDNQAVHAGDLLVRLDDRDYRAALEKADGTVAAQRALLANLDANRRLQEAMILQARAGVAAAEAETVRTRQDQARYKSLSANAAVSVQSWQKADSDYKQAAANQQKAEAALVAAQRELDVIDTRKGQASAALAQATADREQARLNLSYTEVRAPMDGTVGNRRARQGAYVPAGTQMLSLVPAKGLWVDANFKESQLARMAPGQRAVIVADVMPDRVFHGRVASLAPATGAQFSVLPPENATGNFTKIVQRVPVRIVLDDEDALRLLRPGLSVRAEVDARTHP
ncbi:hemolysin D [Bordetella sp. H567]|uniref:HlyD family secretion protein n=1 Tax=Bordetella sp. H567 TaxID=1697043 RepID=UPI00081C87A4|nr:HlyD family secretion protein [Bordetella sp. H567]AOB29621.1 hemolysin D [Bordetella sp. H567]